MTSPIDAVNDIENKNCHHMLTAKKHYLPYLNRISADFTDEKAYKTQNAQEIFTQHILTNSFQMHIIVAGTPRQIYGKNTAEIVIFTRS